MEISSSSGTITIKGNIKSINDFQKIKQTVDAVTNEYKIISVKIVDSISITSSVIGYFNKIVLRDNIDVNMQIGNKDLFNLLGDLNLVSTFKAKKIDS